MDILEPEENQYLFTKFFNDFDRPVHSFVLGISEDRGEYFYVFSYQMNGVQTILLMKSFKDEGVFKKEVNSLQEIFEVSIYSDTYNLKNLTQ